MGEKVWRLKPHDYWHISEYESWFSDMAAKGLHVKKLGAELIQFEKGQPKKMKYHLVVSKRKQMSDEQMYKYVVEGWSYVSSVQYFHLFTAPEDMKVADLHIEQAFILNHLYKRLTINTVILVIGALLVLAMITKMFFLNDTPILHLIISGALPILFLILVPFYLAAISVRGIISIHRLKRSLNESETIGHHALWRKEYRLHQLFTVILLVGCCLTIIFEATAIVKMETKTLPEGEIEFPTVRLSHLEQHNSMIQEIYMIDGVNWANKYSFKWSFLAPVQYEVDESVIVPGEKWKNHDGEYNPSLSVEVFQLRWSALSGSLLNDLIKRNTFDESPAFVEIQHNTFDKLVVQDNLYYKQVIAAKGNAVMLVQYNGHAELEQLLENMAEQIVLLAQ